MKNYQFSKIIRPAFVKGNTVFDNKIGENLVSPCGNRIIVHDLNKNESQCLNAESSHNFTAIDFSPSDLLLAAGNEVGEVHIISMVSRAMLHCLKLGETIRIIKFSYDGKYFAVAKNNTVFIYNCPGIKKAFNAFQMRKVFNSTSNVTSVSWSEDSKLIVIGYEDAMIGIHSIEKYSNFKSCSITGHSASIVNCFMTGELYNFYALSRNGQLCNWGYENETEELILFKIGDKEDSDDDEENQDDGPTPRKNRRVQTPSNGQNLYARFYKLEKFFYADMWKETKGLDRSDISCADYNKRAKILVSGFTNGCFSIHTMPDFGLVQVLSAMKSEISTINLNPKGDWVSLGSHSLQQILVWEWQSESYIFDQQGASGHITSIDFSPNGTNMVLGCEDGKVLLSQVKYSHIFASFKDHTSSVTGVVFTQEGRAVLSSSLDGTVRAYDMTRYRNFRTFTSNRPAQFSCVSVDSSGELVAAGAQEDSDIFIWSLKTGHLLESLKGHEAPVTSLAFSPNSTRLASLSLDKSLRLWDAIDSSSNCETVLFSTEGCCLSFRPDGKELVVGTLDSYIHIINPENGQERGAILGKNILGEKLSSTDLVSSKKNQTNNYFSTISYSPDGQSFVGGGSTKNILMFNAEHQMLIGAYHVTKNLSYDGVSEIMNHRSMTEFGNTQLYEDRETYDEDKLSLPGVKKGDMASRRYKPEMRIWCVKFSPTGSCWAAATTEGVLVYSCDDQIKFEPQGADEEITPRAICSSLKDEKYDIALFQALRLNIQNITMSVIEKIPFNSVESVCNILPFETIKQLLRFLAIEFGRNKHLELYLIWIKKVLECNLMKIHANKGELLPTLALIESRVQEKDSQLLNFSSYSKFHMKYLTNHLKNTENLIEVIPSNNDEEDVVSMKSESENEDEDLLLISS